MKVAREGIPFVAAGFAVLGVILLAAWRFGGAWWFAVFLWSPIAAWIPAFFRNPDRTGPRRAHLVIAPADGKVVSIEREEEPDYVGGPTTRVSVFMNVFNVHVNRHPVAGEVEYRQYRPGRFLNATLDKASTHNERMSLGVRGTHGRVLIRQIAGLVARRIVTDHELGDTVEQGERLGLIRFGSRVDTFVPVGARVRVRVGDRALAGKTILAEWRQA